MAIRIIVDSSADMEEGYARAHDITIIPMTIAFGSEQYAEGVDLSREEFFERLVETDELPRTSQIPPMVFQDLFQEAVDASDEVVCITLSSHISGTYQSACIAAAPFKESVFVVDSENATIGERILAERAWALRDEELSAADIAYCLNQEKKDIRLVASLDTLEYLRRGGRISGAAALVGGMLSHQARGGRRRWRRRGARQGARIEAVEEHGVPEDRRGPAASTSRGPSGWPTRACPTRRPRKYIADSLTQAKAAEEAAADESAVPDDLPLAQVGAVIGTHVGPGGVAFAFFARE